LVEIFILAVIVAQAPLISTSASKFSKAGNLFAIRKSYCSTLLLPLTSVD
jgi:hypothetical protein